MEALNSYSACVQTCPDKAVAYTNRAHCYLKLKSVSMDSLVPRPLSLLPRGLGTRLECGYI